MQSGVLPDVKCMQMQAIGAHLEDERIDQRSRDAQAAVFRQTRLHDLEVM